ncbi:hypothetical protein J437_LFUL009512, partial [Ladona fulva]
MTKAELIEYVTMHKDMSKRFYINEPAEMNGHRVLHLPPYHSHFNAIGMKKLIHEDIGKVTPQRWADMVRHAVKELGDAWKKEGILEECIEQMVVDMRDCSSSE